MIYNVARTGSTNQTKLKDFLPTKQLKRVVPMFMCLEANGALNGNSRGNYFRWPEFNWHDKAAMILKTPEQLQVTGGFNAVASGAS